MNKTKPSLIVADHIKIYSNANHVELSVLAIRTFEFVKTVEYSGYFNKKISQK